MTIDHRGVVKNVDNHTTTVALVISLISAPATTSDGTTLKDFRSDVVG